MMVRWIYSIVFQPNLLYGIVFWLIANNKNYVLRNTTTKLHLRMTPVLIKGLPNTFFPLENALKKTTKYFSRFLFLFESTILPVNNGK